MENNKQTLTLTELQQLAANVDCHIDFQFELTEGESSPDSTSMSGRFTASFKANQYPTSHVCGLMGYNPMIDPPCPRCEELKPKKRLDFQYLTEEEQIQLDSILRSIETVHGIDAARASEDHMKSIYDETMKDIL